MHSPVFVVRNRAIPGAPATRDGRSLAQRASVNLFIKGVGMASTAPSQLISLPKPLSAYKTVFAKFYEQSPADEGGRRLGGPRASS